MNIKEGSVYQQVITKDTYKLGEDVDRTHIGLVFATGIELNQFVFSFGYDLGLSGIGPEVNTGTIGSPHLTDKLAFSVFKIGLGYKL